MLLLFGGSRLAGLGKSTGRALKEFKEETKGLKDADAQPRTDVRPPAVGPDPGAPTQAGSYPLLPAVHERRRRLERRQRHAQRRLT